MSGESRTPRCSLWFSDIQLFRARAKNAAGPERTRCKSFPPPDGLL